MLNLELETLNLELGIAVEFVEKGAEIYAKA
jgi:hypothetical protein